MVNCFIENSNSELQQFTLNGSLIISKSNNQCLTAGAQDCGKFAYCDKSQAQTKKDHSILNVFLQQCDGSNVNQQWRLARPENATLPKFTPLNESASTYPPPEADLAASIQKNSPQVFPFFFYVKLSLFLSLPCRMLRIWIEPFSRLQVVLRPQKQNYVDFYGTLALTA